MADATFGIALLALAEFTLEHVFLSNYKNYSDLTLDELEQLVQELEIMSIQALKKQKLKHNMKGEEVDKIEPHLVKLKVRISDTEFLDFVTATISILNLPHFLAVTRQLMIANMRLLQYPVRRCFLFRVSGVPGLLKTFMPLFII